MTAGGARRLAWTIAVLAFTLVAAAGSLSALEVLGGPSDRPFYWEDAAAGAVLPLIGAVVLHHPPRNPISWVVLAMGSAGTIAIAVSALLVREISEVADRSLRPAQVGLWRAEGVR